MKKLIEQFLKFGVVGVIAFLIDYGIMMILSNIFSVPLVIANVISFTVSVIFNYVVSMKYVFEGRDDISKTREFITFVVLSIIGGVLNTAILSGIVDGIFAKVEEGTLYYATIQTGAKILATAIVTVYNFVTRKIFLEKKKA